MLLCLAFQFDFDKTVRQPIPGGPKPPHETDNVRWMPMQNFS